MLTRTFKLEYWLSLLKVITIIVSPRSGLQSSLVCSHSPIQIFIIIGIVVNCGGNTDSHYIGGENWRIPGAPFVGGIGGFASVFVTASFACKFCEAPYFYFIVLTTFRRWHGIHCHYGWGDEGSNEEPS